MVVYIIILFGLNICDVSECKESKARLPSSLPPVSNLIYKTPQPIIKEIYEVPLDEEEESTYSTDENDEYSKSNAIKNIENKNVVFKTIEQKNNDQKESDKKYNNIPLFARQPTKSEDCYIASLQGKTSEFIKVLESIGADIMYKYTKNINAVSFCLTKADDIIKLQESAGQMIEYIETDNDYYSASIQIDPPKHMFYMLNFFNRIFSNWVLNNKIMDFLPFRYIYKFFYTYYKYDFTGKNVMIYMLDTSVDEKHDELKGRVKNMFSNNMSCSTHGTSVALLIAGKTYGFAKDSLIKVLNVLDCDGKSKLSDILFALETINRTTGNTAVLYFGVSGPRSDIFNSVIDSLSEKKIILISPAGNNRDLGCNYSPGSAQSIINVGSLDMNAKISKFSNFNNCIRLYSLGENIEIANSLRSGKMKLAGTSYSAALVASAVAIYLESSPYSDFKSVWKYLSGNSEIKDGYLVQKIPELSSKGFIEEKDIEYIDENSGLVKFMLFLTYVVIGLLILFGLVLIYRRRRHRELII